MVSRSRDGSRLARVIGRLGMTAVRASSSRGAVRGFLQMHRWLTRPGGRAAMALDGPRGPRHQAKPGIAMLARKSGAWVVPIEFTHTRRIVFNSWDRTRLPLPFGHTRVVFGEPIDAAEWGDDDTANAAQIQRALLVLRDASSSCATSHR